VQKQQQNKKYFSSSSLLKLKQGEEGTKNVVIKEMIIEKRCDSRLTHSPYPCLRGVEFHSHVDFLGFLWHGSSCINYRRDIDFEEICLPHADLGAVCPAKSCENDAKAQGWRCFSLPGIRGLEGTRRMKRIIRP
jgi:hypothetical protein